MIPEYEALLLSICCLQLCVLYIGGSEGSRGWINARLKFEIPEAHVDKLLNRDFLLNSDIELRHPLPLFSYLTLRYLNHNLNAFFCFLFL
ncbi:hypothetical protein RchiOBHm_Chr7g0219601 [Rosa chinensis]|uniref:Uncharacterized protein n=1 Tax=Rosa chinensis TaxID=74649 RepID=A0A2P6PCK1_ROSCH|nr:hypothetical protein RchiOBHm_Chr7g0219601 [Rosa chinensis]